jgi:hypothetical protein
MTLDETTVFFHTYWNILNHVVETTFVYTGAYWRCKMCNEMSQKDVTGLHALQLYGSSKGFKPARKFRVQEFCVIGWMIVNPPAFVRFVYVFPYQFVTIIILPLIGVVGNYGWWNYWTAQNKLDCSRITIKIDKTW